MPARPRLQSDASLLSMNTASRVTRRKTVTNRTLAYSPKHEEDEKFRGMNINIALEELMADAEDLPQADIAPQNNE